MVDAIVDRDFFEVLGFRHYRGSPLSDDRNLRELYVDRIYGTYVDEEQFQVCDATVPPLVVARCAYHRGLWQVRPHRQWSRIFERVLAGERK
jgi:deoxyhypusine synthase